MERCTEVEVEMYKMAHRLEIITDKVNEMPLTSHFKAKVLNFIIDYECAEDEEAKYIDISRVEYEFINKKEA